MHRIQRYTLIILAALAVSLTATAISDTEMDDFEDGTTENWGHGAPTGLVTNVTDGGPMGTGDNFLRVESIGGTGPGSRPVTINAVQWTGDYNAIGNTFTISMDLINLGTTDLNIRIGLDGGTVPMEDGPEGKTFERWVTTTPFFLPAPAPPTEGPVGWQNAVFELSTADMTQVEGIAPLSATLDGVNQMRILSSSTATWFPAQVAAVIGIDNINVVSTPVELQSFTID